MYSVQFVAYSLVLCVCVWPLLLPSRLDTEQLRAAIDQLGRVVAGLSEQVRPYALSLSHMYMYTYTNEAMSMRKKLCKENAQIQAEQ